MSIPLQLSVERGGTTYTYSDVRLLARESTRTARVSEFEVELDAITVFVGPDGSTSEIADYTDPVALPSDVQHRAELKRTDTGDVILNGSLRTDELRYNDLEDAWRVRVFNDAPRQFWADLERHFWDEILQEGGYGIFANGDPPYLEERQVKAWRRDDQPFETSADPEFRQDTVLVNRPLSVLKFIFDDRDWTFDLPSTFYPSGTPNLWVWINRWRLKTVVKQLSALGGLRLTASFEPFPSTGINVSASRTDYDFPAGLPDIEADRAAGAAQIRTEGEGKALQFANDVAEASPNPLQYGIINEDSHDTDFSMGVFAPPPAWALLGMDEWEVDPPYKEETATGSVVAEGDSRTPIGDVEELRLKVAPIETDGPLIDGRVLLPDEKILARWLNLGDSKSDVPEEDENAYIFATRTDGSGGYIGAWGEAPDGEPLVYRSDAWVSLPFQQRGQLRTQRLLRARYHTSADFEVGDPGAGVRTKGSDWVVAEARQDLNSGVQELELQRPPPNAPANRDAPDVPSYSWTVIGAEAAVVTIDRGDGKEDWLLAHWGRTATEAAREYRYDVRYEQADGSFVDDESYATAFSLQLATPGNGGGSYARTVEIRPVSKNATGDYVTVTAD